MTKIWIRAVEAGDRVPDDLPALRPDEDSPGWRRTRVAHAVHQAGDQIVGTASVALSAATDTYFCEIDVVPRYRRQGIGTRLYAAIHQLTDPRFPVLARAMDSHPLRRQFAESLGYSVLTRCPAPWIDPPSPAAQQWAATQTLPDGYASDIIGDEPLALVKEAWLTYFAWAHEPFGTVHVDRIPQMWDQYSPGVDPAASAITYSPEGSIVAFSLVSPDAWDGRTFIVAETVDRGQSDGAQLLRATVATSLMVLAERGTHRVQLEGHTTDPHTPDLARSLPPAGSDPMDILKLAGRGEAAIGLC